MIGHLLTLLAASAPADTVSLTPGMVIDRSVVIRAAPYQLKPAPGDSVVVRVRGSDLDIDFAGASLVGTPYESAPDAATGIGVLIEGGRNITIRRGTVRGFKIGILARGVAGLRLLDNDLSYNWKPRLWSGPGHESLVDWLYFHHNEAEEWLRYGGGVYLADVDGGEIRGNRAFHGMNGLLLVRSRGLLVAGNDFSYLSGLGIGMYRSSNNRILQNRADYCVRGYVDGVYDRGQDSAALLLYEQSSNNIVAYNSFTHSGDGVFLWAGQSTMDDGTGGANDNLFFGNDVSFAVANGIEATFSRNRFVGNLIEGGRYGIWGGYSFESEIRGNRFIRNTTGIAIEHGQNNRITGNDFEGDRTGIRLWWNRLEPSDWGYPKHRDTRSRTYVIQANRFLGNGLAMALDNTQRVTLGRNQYFAVDTLFRVSGDSGVFRRDARRTGSAALPLARWQPPRRDRAAPAPIAGVPEAFALDDPRRGRAGILVDEWGPYDWKAPRLWPRTADSAVVRGPVWYRVVGPDGEWRLAGARGASLNRLSGKVGDSVLVTPANGPVVDWEVELEYLGQAVVAPDGATSPAGVPFRFAARRFVAPIAWKLGVFAWDSVTDPRSAGDAWRRALAAAPVVERRDSVLDWVWGRPRLPAIPAARFLVVAEGTVEVPKSGDFEFVAISDDGVRVWIDDRLVIDHWAPHESEIDRAPLRSGKRRIRLEYYQVDGWVELRGEVRRK